MRTQTTDLLNTLLPNAKLAYRNTSFDPDKRGQQMIDAYNQQLAEDIEFLYSIDSITQESIMDYTERYKRLFSNWLNAKSNTFSVMITGGSNFPVARHAKANRSEENHYKVFQEWRSRAKKSIIRKSQPVKSYVSELDRYKDELESMKLKHSLLKAGNVRIKKANANGEDLREYLKDTFNVPDHMYSYTMKFGFGLTNNNANMKRVEQRIKELEAKELLRQTSPESSYKFDGGEVVLNY